MEVNIHHAKTNLSRLIVRAEAGEEVVIARAGKPAVRLVPVHAATRTIFKPGALKGRLQVPSNFLDADPAMEQLFSESPLLSHESASPLAGDQKKNDRIQAKP
jgi:prevent-host-death family protein